MKHQGRQENAKEETKNNNHHDVGSDVDYSLIIYVKWRFWSCESLSKGYRAANAQNKSGQDGPLVRNNDIAVIKLYLGEDGDGNEVVNNHNQYVKDEASGLGWLWLVDIDQRCSNHIKSISKTWCFMMFHWWHSKDSKGLSHGKPQTGHLEQASHLDSPSASSALPGDCNIRIIRRLRCNREALIAMIGMFSSCSSLSARATCLRRQWCLTLKYTEINHSYWILTHRECVRG